jgi:hypothetical protein
MNPTRRVKLAWALAALSVLLLLFSGWFMAQRIADFHSEHRRNIFLFKEVDDRSFTYANRKVTLTDETDKAGVDYVNVAYGDETLRLRVTIPGMKELPGLRPHMDWLRVVRFLPMQGGDAVDAVKASFNGENVDRLVIVTRTPPAGADPKTWGSVWRKDWVFDFYEFNPAGGFNREKLNYPTTRRSEPEKAGELAENSWQMQAALLLMPKGMGPNYKPKNDALSAVGWTLPVAGTSVALLLASVLVAAGVGQSAGTVKAGEAHSR